MELRKIIHVVKRFFIRECRNLGWTDSLIFHNPFCRSQLKCVVDRACNVRDMDLVAIGSMKRKMGCVEELFRSCQNDPYSPSACNVLV